MDLARERGPVKGVKELGDYVTLDGAAQALGLTYWTVRGLIKRQHVPTIRIGRSTLVRLDDMRCAVSPTKSQVKDKRSKHTEDSTLPRPNSSDALTRGAGGRAS